MESERDDLYDKFVKSIHDVQQKTGFKNLLLEKKLGTLTDQLEKKVRFTLNIADVAVYDRAMEDLSRSFPDTLCSMLADLHLYRKRS